MNSRTARRLVLPATLLVTTYVSASACKYDPSKEEYCEDIEKQSDCDTVDGCGWSEEYQECVNTCFMFQTQEECEAVDRCFWEADGGATDTAGTETGGDGACHEPFS